MSSPYTESSPILRKATREEFDLDALDAWAVREVARRTDFLSEYLSVVMAGGIRMGIDPWIVIGQSHLETGGWTSAAWMKFGNPGGIGVTGYVGGPSDSSNSQTFANGTEAAMGHLAHLVAYLWPEDWANSNWPGSWPNPWDADKRFDAPGKAGYMATDLASLGRQEFVAGMWRGWADNDYYYGKKIAERANLIAGVARKDVPVAMPAVLDYSSLSFPVQVKLIDPAQWRQRPGTPMYPTRSTWHGTGNPNPGTRSDSHHTWMLAGCPDKYGRPTQTSWHFTVDDQKAIQHIPLNEVAWHAGNATGNTTSIGVEECENSDRVEAKTRSNAAELHAFLQKNLGLTETVQHNFWNGKDCPYDIRHDGAWSKVQQLIASFKSGTPAPPALPAPRPLPKPYKDIIAENGQIVLATAITRNINRDVKPRMWALEDADVVSPGSLKKGTKVTVVSLAEGTDGRLWAITEEGYRFHADALVAA